MDGESNNVESSRRCLFLSLKGFQQQCQGSLVQMLEASVGEDEASALLSFMWELQYTTLLLIYSIFNQEWPQNDNRPLMISDQPTPQSQKVAPWLDCLPLIFWNFCQGYASIDIIHGVMQQQLWSSICRLQLLQLKGLGLSSWKT